MDKNMPKLKRDFLAVSAGTALAGFGLFLGASGVTDGFRQTIGAYAGQQTIIHEKVMKDVPLTPAEAKILSRDSQNDISATVGVFLTLPGLGLALQGAAPNFRRRLNKKIF